jgi:hypothetical protein
MTEWTNIPDDITEYQGFVYCITNKLNGKFYIGKKFFWTTLKRKPLKGKKNKRHERIETDWRDYWGSSKALLEDVEKFGEKNFHREIIVLCKTKWECAYDEAYFQFRERVLLRDDSYNGIINIRLGKRK